MANKRDVLWTADEIYEAFQLYRYGYTNRTIGHKLGRTPNSIQAMMQREFGLLGLKRARKYTADALLSSPPLLAGMPDVTVCAEANTAFLISMLRAGHTPGQGEFAIPSENRVVRPSDLVGA